MRIDEALQKVKEYQAELGYDFKYLIEEHRMEHIRALALAQMMEVAEFVDWLPWKPWRALSSQKYDHEEAAYELIDQFFFMCNLWFAIGLQPEDFERFFKEKLAENHSRIIRGYNQRVDQAQGELDL